MPRVLVVHGAGMNMRGKVQVDIFGPMTLPEYDERIRGYAKEIGVEVEIFHSNVEGEIVNRLYAANDEGFDAAIFNPAAFGTGYPALVAAISQVKFPTVEVHISNPIRRGPASQTAAVSQGVVAGFGIAGYALALRGIRDMLPTKRKGRTTTQPPHQPRRITRLTGSSPATVTRVSASCPRICGRRGSGFAARPRAARPSWSCVSPTWTETAWRHR